MRMLRCVALSLLCLSCGGKSAVAPPPATTTSLVVFVSWQGQGLADRKLQIIELSLEQTTGAGGYATFALPAGTYTLRAFVTRPGPLGRYDQTVTVRGGESNRADVVDCLPCMSPN